MEMKDYPVFIERVTIGAPIGNLYRKEHVLVLIVNKEGDFVLGKKKDFYPEHMARLLGGGVNEGEDSAVAAQREIKEELSLDIPVSSFKPLCGVITQAETDEGYMEMRTSLFLLTVAGSENLKPGDDISGLQTFTPAEYKDLVRSMENLSGEYVTEKFSFLWSDWGKIYAPIHRYALERYGVLGLSSK